MAKKRRQNKKKHGEVKETSGEFMSEVPESNDESWSGDKPLAQLDNSSEAQLEENSNSIVDPFAEQMNLSSEEVHQQMEETLPQEDHNFADEDDHNIESEKLESNSVESIGSFLLAHRESRQISLKIISQSTKISLTNLEYLESDQLEALPDRAYVTGYVKSYVRALGADQKAALTLLEETYRSLGATPRVQEIVIPQAQNPAATNTQFPIKLVGGAVAALVVVIGLVIFFLTRPPSESEGLPQKIIDNTPSETSEIKPQTLNAETPLQSKVENTTNQASTDSSEEPAETKDSISKIIEKPKVPAIATPVKKEVKKEPFKAVIKEESNPVEQEQLSKPEKEVEVKKAKEKKKFYPLAGTLYRLDTEMSEERRKELLPGRFTVPPNATNQNIFITAVNGDSWLTYKSDNDQIRKFVLKKGRSLLVRADEARVFLGNLKAVKIFLNNHPLKISSKTGVKSLVFPQENAGNYVMPLFIYKENGTVQTSSDYILQNP